MAFAAHLLSWILALLSSLPLAFSLAASSDVAYSLFDRFRAACPADPSHVLQFDPTLVVVPAVTGDPNEKDESASSIWVAVYRFSNNKPSVLVRDEFLRAMRSATDTRNTNNNNNEVVLDRGGTMSTTTAGASTSSPLIEINAAATRRGTVPPLAPVAVARLSRSSHHEGAWLLDCMRCVLKKEDTDSTCDGNSEHNEAISVAIDALLEHYLSVCDRFEGAIRTKATIYSASVLEDRGFEPVKQLEMDMATHVSSLDACMERYAARSISTLSKSPGARKRALNIISLLSRLNRDEELKVARRNKVQEESDREDYDPWAGSMIR